MKARLIPGSSRKSDRIRFNSRACEGATPARGWPAAHASGFNPRACEGATSPDGAPLTTVTSFNSRACEGATVGRALDPAVGSVSIHAPVKARLPVLAQRVTFFPVSILAPVKARRFATGTHPWKQIVSILAPVKARPSPPPGMPQVSPVSILAPVKARPVVMRTAAGNRRFNPRACEGAAPLRPVH